MTAKKLGIIADDLTGAMDSSGYFAGLGFGTVVILDPGYPSGAEVAVITTNSRAEDPEIARQRVRQAVRNLAGRAVYKKIDSTLRGNIAVELEVAIGELASDKAVVAPAFPAVGRTVSGGNLLVNGVLVAETQFANDPISPVRESHLPTLLERETGRPVGSVPVKDIEAGPDALYRTIAGMPQSIVVCDAAEQRHLNTIAGAAVRAGERWLLCGSGGLARELYLFLGGGAAEKSEEAGRRRTGPALVVVGTRNRVAADQLLRAEKEMGLPLLKLNVEKLETGGAFEDTVEEAERLLSRGNGVAVSSTFSEYVPARKQSISADMAGVAAGILARCEFGGIFLSGGDIALEVCRRLGVSAIRVHGEVEPGVPAGEFIGGQWEGMRVVTKAGGFGTEEAIVRSIAYLEKGVLS